MTCKTIRFALLVLLAIEFVGGLLYYILGDHFVFYRWEQYKPIGLVSLFFLLPALAWAVVTLPLHRRRPRKARTPPALAAVFAFLLSTFAVFYAPIGWMALATWGTGMPQIIGHMSLSQVNKARSYTSKGCDQEGKLQLPTTAANICLEGLDPLPRVNGPVIVTGREGPFGFLVQELATPGDGQ